MKARLIHLRETASTNTYMASVKSLLPSGTVIYTNNQTSGRGQRGNSWEAEQGKNLTFSLLLRDLQVPVPEQFYISEAVSLAITETLQRYIGNLANVKVKWPNDIYVNDKKICGILIENTIGGNRTLSYCIVGVGLNVNQTEFISDAPNPVSLANIIGTETDLLTLLQEVADRMLTRVAEITPDNTKALHSEYKAVMYRNDGLLHPFTLPDGTNFDAIIDDVAPDGKMTLKRADGTCSEYYFKEVAFAGIGEKK